MAKATKKAAKKAAPKKKKPVIKKAAKKTAPKKSASKKKAAPRKTSLQAANLDNLAMITYEVKFFGGAGQILFVGDNLDRTSTAAETFEVSQPKGSQSTSVGGTAPNSSDGRIEVQVQQGSDILSPFAKNKFKGLFDSNVNYTIK